MTYILTQDGAHLVGHSEGDIIKPVDGDRFNICGENERCFMVEKENGDPDNYQSYVALRPEHYTQA